ARCSLHTIEPAQREVGVADQLARSISAPGKNIVLRGLVIACVSPDAQESRSVCGDPDEIAAEVRGERETVRVKDCAGATDASSPNLAETRVRPRHKEIVCQRRNPWRP